jgi:COP9 signalosome complex subunit 3
MTFIKRRLCADYISRTDERRRFVRRRIPSTDTFGPVPCPQKHHPPETTGETPHREREPNQTPNPSEARSKGKTPPVPTAAAAAAAMAIESVEALVAHIQGLSGSAEELAQLHALLKQADGDALRAHSAALLPFLSQLHPGAHSLGYLFLL